MSRKKGKKKARVLDIIIFLGARQNWNKFDPYMSQFWSVYIPSLTPVLTEISGRALRGRNASEVLRDINSKKWILGTRRSGKRIFGEKNRELSVDGEKNGTNSA